MKSLLLLIFLSVSVNLIAQNDYYEKTFDWVVTTFEKNDAGFQFIVDKKGEEAYNKATEEARIKVKAVKDDKEFVATVRSWLSFFRKGHIYFNYGSKYVWPERPTLTNEQIREKYKDIPHINITEEEFQAKYRTKSNPHPIERMWRKGPHFRIGFVPDEEKEGSFIGVVFTANHEDSLYWKPGDIIMKVCPDKENEMKFHIEAYDKERNLKHVSHMEFMVGDKTLFGLFPNPELWEIDGDRNRRSSELFEFYAYVGHNEPYIAQFTNKTTYLYLNSFDSRNKAAIDALVAKNDSLIRSSENLIIDIRNCRGGGDGTFSSILPYLYTNPIRTVGIKLRATEFNANMYESYKKDMDTSSSSYLNSIITRMKENIEGFFNPLSDKPYYINERDTVFPYPKKVGIIAHERNGSADEQLLLLSKQSFKTKIFGHTSSGAFDASNMSSAVSADGRFVLGLTMSLRIGFEYFPVDDIGLQPDFYIDPFIERFGWIDYVREVLEY